MKKIILTLIVFALFASMSLYVKAGLVHNSEGWAWGGGAGVSGDGTHTNFGFISANNTNTGAGGLTDYGLIIPSSDNNVSGRVWSENIGWIDFDPGGPYPPGAPATSVTRSGDFLEGWARIFSIANELGNSGGWEGWIRMRGLAQDGSPYGVQISSMNGDALGSPTYAWSNELGWVNFGGVDIRRTLKICRTSCDSTSQVMPNSTIRMMQNETINLRACYSRSAGCDDSDPSVDVTDPISPTVWTEASDPNNIVESLSFNNPDEVLSSSTTNRGTGASVDVSHDGQTVSFGVEVYEPCSYHRCGLPSEPGEDELSCLLDNSDNLNFNVSETCCSNLSPTSPCQFPNESTEEATEGVCDAVESNTPKCGGTGRSPSNWIETSP